MSFTIDARDARSIKAVQIAATFTSWIPCTRRDGRQVFAIPSQSVPNKHYIVDPVAQTCDCQDSRRRGLSTARIGLDGNHFQCKHLRALNLYGELITAQEALPKKQRGHLRLVSPNAEAAS